VFGSLLDCKYHLDVQVGCFSIFWSFCLTVELGLDLWVVSLLAVEERRREGEKGLLFAVVSSFCMKSLCVAGRFMQLYGGKVRWVTSV
jgi:hypothetical protein